MAKLEVSLVKSGLSEATDYYVIMNLNNAVGAIRIVRNDNKTYRISPLFVLPEYQGRGIAQKVFAMIEQIYDDAEKWVTFLGGCKMEVGKTKSAGYQIGVRRTFPIDVKKVIE